MRSSVTTADLDALRAAIGGGEVAERVRIALEQLVRGLAPWAEPSAPREG